MADETETDWYDLPALWSHDSREEPASRSRGRRSGRARRTRTGADSVRWQPASSGGRGRGRGRDDDWLADGSGGDDWRDRYRALRARSRWPLAFSAAGVVVLFFGGLMLFQPPGMSGAMGVPCDTAVSCSQPTAAASVPAGPGMSSSAPARAPSSPAPSATASAKASTPAPRTSSSSASPAPSATAALRSASVTYSLVRHSPSGFEGQLTIVNKSHSALNDWKLVVVLPNDHVQSSWAASFQETGDTVTFVPPAYALSIPAGGRVVEDFMATGTTLKPVSCTLNGAAC